MRVRYCFVVALILTVLAAVPIRAQEHQHDHGQEQLTPLAPERVVEIPPGGVITEETTREVDVAIQDISTPHADRPLKICEFESLAIGRETKFMVLLPADYETSGKQYPVLYLLHGFSQNYTVWPIMGVAQHVGDRDLIVVMPDAGNSWFINWSESFDGQLNNWEDFIIYDLIHIVDQTFRTVPAREGRAISGVSMGGYGALTIGLRNPGLFCSIGSQSGALDFARSARARLEAGEKPQRNVAPPPKDDDRDSNVPELIRIEGFTMQHERYPNGIAFNTVDETKAYDPFELIQQVPAKYLPHIYLDCGLDDGLIATNQEFAAFLMANKIPFAFAQTPGAHGANYWTRELATDIAVQWAVLDRNVKAWTVRTAAEQLSVLDAATGAEEHQHDAPEQP
jgi:S-formylglutathione hydrolase FrmB